MRDPRINPVPGDVINRLGTSSEMLNMVKKSERDDDCITRVLVGMDKDLCQGSQEGERMNPTARTSHQVPTGRTSAPVKTGHPAGRD